KSVSRHDVAGDAPRCTHHTAITPPGGPDASTRVHRPFTAQHRPHLPALSLAFSGGRAAGPRRGLLSRQCRSLPTADPARNGPPPRALPGSGAARVPILIHARPAGRAARSAAERGPIMKSLAVEIIRCRVHGMVPSRSRLELLPRPTADCVAKHGSLASPCGWNSRRLTAATEAGV